MEIKNISKVANESYDLIRGTLAVLQSRDIFDPFKLFIQYGEQIEERSSFRIHVSSQGEPRALSTTQVATIMTGTIPASITGFTLFDGALYAAGEFESDAPAQIWRSSGGDWTMSSGFGDSETLSTGGMAVFANYLYVGAGNITNGAQIWRTNDGTTWETVISPGFGDSNNQKVEMVFVFQNQLYASVKNTVTGLELWRTMDGSVWEQANLDGFGDSSNAGTNWSNATAEFQCQFYVGTANIVNGGELWRMGPPCVYLPLILH